MKTLLRGVAQLLFVIAALSFFVGGRFHPLLQAGLSRRTVKEIFRQQPTRAIISGMAYAITHSLFLNQRGHCEMFPKLARYEAAVNVEWKGSRPCLSAYRSRK